MKRWVFVFLIAILATGCAGTAPAADPTPSPVSIRTTAPTDAAAAFVSLTATPGAPPDPGACNLNPVAVPTLPAVIPGYTELDTTTGLHITGAYQELDLESYRLKITGKVDYPMELTYDQLRCMPKVTIEPVLICPGYFEDVAEWSGVRLRYLLDLAGAQDGAQEVIMVGGDGYEASVSMEQAMLWDNFVAYEWEGQPLPILHGFPARTVMPTMQGNKWVKWLLEIRVEE